MFLQNIMFHQHSVSRHFYKQNTNHCMFIKEILNCVGMKPTVQKKLSKNDQHRNNEKIKHETQDWLPYFT